MIRIAAALVGIATIAAAAAQDPKPLGPWKAERAKRGDTTVVRTLSGSVWGEKVALVEELRIGSKDGEGPDAFGFILCLAVFRDGVVAVFDNSVPALRLFDPSGKHLRTLGRDGAGPGEYRNQCLGLAVDPTEVLLLYDPNNARLDRWKEGGTLLPSWRAPGRLFTAQALQVDTTGRTYIKITTDQPEPGKEWKFALIRMNPAGEIADTLLPPTIAGDAPIPGTFFSPQKHWHVNRTGAFVSGFSGQYAITVAPPGQGAVRIERTAKQVALLPEERSDFQARADAMSRNRSQGPSVISNPPGAVPSEKPFWRSIQSDLDRRIWVYLYGVGEHYDPPTQSNRSGAPPMPPLRWRERRAFDVFEPDGRYLGRVELPYRTSFYEARGDNVWAVQLGEDDEQYIVRYRIAGIR